MYGMCVHAQLKTSSSAFLDFCSWWLDRHW